MPCSCSSAASGTVSTGSHGPGLSAKPTLTSSIFSESCMSEMCDAESGQTGWTASHEAEAAVWYESSLALASDRVGG